VKEAIKEKTRHAWDGWPGSDGIAKQQKRAWGVRCSLFASKPILAYFLFVTKFWGNS